jgi:hypothetical protein
MPRVHIAMTLAALATALGGCTAAAPSSSGNFSGAQGDVAKVIGEIAKAAPRANGKSICDNLLAPSLARQVASGGTDCPTEVTKALRDASDTRLDVKAVTVSGSTAQAKVQRAKNGPTSTFSLAKDAGGGWRLTSFGGG